MAKWFMLTPSSSSSRKSVTGQRSRSFKVVGAVIHAANYITLKTLCSSIQLHRPYHANFTFRQWFYV